MRLTSWGLGRPRRGVAAVPAWTLATVLSMVVATLGVQEIASRVADPVHLDGRTGQEPGAPIELAARSVDPGPTPSSSLTVSGTTSSGIGPLDDGGPEASAPEASFVPTIPPPPAPPPGDWEVVTPGGSQTRWAEAPDDEVLWRLEYQALPGQWEPGYADDADVALVTPWLDVPADAARPGITVWDRVDIEPGYDFLEISWTAGDATWHRVGRVSAFGGDTRRLEQLAIEAPDGMPDRVRVRLRFTSDVLSSSATGTMAGTGGVWVEGIAVTDLGAPITSLGRPRPGPSGPVPSAARAVVALSGSGINPYHKEFRDDSPRAFAHPSTYLDGYPEDAVTLWLSLDAPTLDQALERDAAIWLALEPGRLYWVPGTRVIGIRAAEAAVFSCDRSDEDWGLGAACGLDGSAMWLGSAAASVAVGRTLGSCPECLLVAGQGFGGDEVAWMVGQSFWIDVHAELEATGLLVTGLSPWGKRLAEVRDAAARQPVLAPAGLGAYHEVLVPLSPAGLWTTEVDQAMAVASAPTPGEWTWPGGVPGVITVQMHDHGHPVQKSTSPEFVAEGCGVTVARGSIAATSDTAVGPRFAVAAAAGAIAAAVLDVRRQVGDHGSGVVDGVLATAAVGRTPTAGPMADGTLDLQEALDVLRATAVVPTVGEQRCGVGDPYPLAPPVPVASLPAPSRPPLVGYGELAPLADLVDALLGRTSVPERPWSDAWQAVREQSREAWYQLAVEAFG